MSEELYFLMRTDKDGFDQYAVAASRDRIWCEDLLERLPPDKFAAFRLLKLHWGPGGDRVHCFYDRWCEHGNFVFTGLGSDAHRGPELPMTPRKRVSISLWLDREPQCVALQSSTLAAASAGAPPRGDSLPGSGRRRWTPGFQKWSAAALVWLTASGLWAAACWTQPASLAPHGGPPSDFAFPAGYERVGWIEHGGWVYFQGELDTSGFSKDHLGLSWERIDPQVQEIRVTHPKAVSIDSHGEYRSQLAPGPNQVEDWRDNHFCLVEYGYFYQWDDGSVMVYDFDRDRIAGMLSPGVVARLF